MEEDKKELLMRQMPKMEEVLECPETNFADCGIDDEVGFMTMAKDNLKALMDEK